MTSKRRRAGRRGRRGGRRQDGDKRQRGRRTGREFVRASQCYLTGKGFTFANDIQVHIKYATGIPEKGVLLTFPSMASSRVFYYTCRDDVWTNDIGTQRITIQLYNFEFQTEMQDVSIRRLAAQGVTPQQAGQQNPAAGAAALGPQQS